MLYVRLIYLLLFFLCSAIGASPLQERLYKAKNGDYLVAECGKMITVLAVRSITPQTVIIEEITIPSQKLKTKPTSWGEWVKAKAPGHTSWSMMEISRFTGEVIECYSFSRASWLQLSSQESLIATLLQLPLATVTTENRRRIGPPPQTGEEDRRKIWEPPFIFEGVQQAEIHCDVYQTTWPQDGTELAGRTIILYFDRSQRFPFPFWIHIEAAHAHISFHAIDSGSNFPSPYRTLPRRVPELVGEPQKTNTGLRIILKSPKYYENFDIFAVDITDHNKQIYPISHSLTKGQEQNICIIEIPEDALHQVLEQGHQYHWLIVPTGYSESYVETQQVFVPS